jgi:hypothetical protein
MNRYLLAALTALTLLAIPATASASPVRECGSMYRNYGIVNLTARNMPCSSARQFARDYVRGRNINMVATTHYRDGWLDVRLVRNCYVVRFQWGVE